MRPDETHQPLACPACFANFGFRHTVERFARKRSGVCPQCGIDGSVKLSRSELEEAVVEFFVDGWYITETFAPVYQVNRSNSYCATFDPTLSSDAALAGHLTGLVVFDYGPPLWRLGMTEHYDEFEAGGERRKRAAEAIVAAAPSMSIPTSATLFRIRLNARADESITRAAAFDPPPASMPREPGRWDELNFPVLYLADDIELCLHECRTNIADEIIVAALQPARELQLLDLTGQIARVGADPFKDPNIFLCIMCRSRGTWIDYCRAISRAAKTAGYDGIRYISYYSQAKHAAESLNIAIFGRPLEEKLLEIRSINRLRISNVSFEFKFGPALYGDAAMDEELARMMTNLEDFVREACRRRE
ncbi:MAG: RES family NAD+ phosphorylase [Rhodospirillales bacterium]|nr:RES family NAD+ phosphorylase [Rhodospirillales bacterium]